MEASTGLTLTLKLDDPSLEVLEDLAARQRSSIDEFIVGLLRKAIRTEEKQRGASHRQRALGLDAPLDAFLPEGADPFAPLSHGESGLASSFAEVQTRMRFAGTPSLLREPESQTMKRGDRQCASTTPY